MSHEIRTPLNAIIGLGYLLEQTTLSEDQTQYVGKIQFAGRALLGVVNNVLDLSKIEAGEMSLEDESFDLPVLVRNVSQMLASQAAAKGIELNLRSAADLPRLARGDASRLRQILVNLVNNGIKFTQAGHVELKTFCTEQSFDRVRLRCEVNDTGVGIEADMLERLFAPFTQADASTTRRFGGTGLGLSIARRFVELMGGEIGVSSTVAVGSTFWIEIPLQIAHGIDVAGVAPGVGGLQILVADSRGDVADGIEAMVRALGWSPTVVCTDEQLLDTLNNAEPRASPDVIVLNLSPGGVDTRQLHARLEQNGGHGAMPPAILVADNKQSYARHRKAKRAMDVVLLRPLTSSALFNAVNAITANRPESHERVLQSTNFGGRDAQWLCGVHVLVADDSDINVQVARRILEKQGAVVATCSDGTAAVEYVRFHGQQLDAVLMDIQMPILDGNGATRQIRGALNLQILPIVALTAGALVGERQRSLEAGMNDFVSKPFEPQALIRKVRRLVEHARGEPIPLVMLDAIPAGRIADSPYPPSIDVGVVEQMFGEDIELFKSLLGRVLRDFADLALPISLSPDDASTRSRLKARTHKLKGSAGIIGASSVVQWAGAAMIALERGRPAKIVNETLVQLAAALSTLGEEAERWMRTGAQPDPGEDGRLPGLGVIKSSDIDELRELLEAQNLAAIDKFGALSQRLSTLMDAARFESLRDAVNSLEFQTGANLIRETRASDYRAA
jgi:CheY-like chemotaxis protein